jgi:hypothetical protein
MRRYMARIAVVCVVVLTVAALLPGLWTLRRIHGPAKVSLTFVEYKGRPSDTIRYAELRLSNHTASVVRYPVMRDADAPRPTCLMVLYREKMTQGWSEERVEPESVGAIFSPRDLKPGQGVTFLTPVKPGALPKRVGVACEFPVRPEPGRIKSEVKLWSMRIRGVLQMESPRDDRVWCETVLLVPKSTDNEAAK